jgi:hypothetical protein
MINRVRRLLVVVVLAFGVASATFAASQLGTVSSAGVRLVVPAGWHAVVSKTPSCDPERLIAASSARIRFGSGGRLAAPGKGHVLVLLLDDRLRQDRPVGDLERPAHFSVTWNRLVRLQGGCGLPNTPAFMRYFKTRNRYLGFIVYPGASVDNQRRAQTLAMMDSLRVSP